MKKLITWICFILVMINNTFSQRDDFIESFREYRIANLEINNAIDEVITYTKDCTYYTALNKPYLIWVCIYDTSLISVGSIPYSLSAINGGRNDSRVIEEGLCYYDDHSILITSFIPNYIDKFFKLTGNQKTLEFHNSKNIMDHIRPVYESVEVFYDIVDNKWIKKEDDISLCRNDYYFYYMIQPGDTWISIAKECGCSMEDLTERYEDKEEPIPGCLLIIEYHFNDGKFIGVTRLQ